MKQVVFEDRHLKAYHRAGASRHTLATFANHGFAADRNMFWAEAFCDKEDFDAIGFVAKASNWFPARSMTEAMRSLDAVRSRPIVAYGHSQGGYAALKYSRMLDVAGVVACAPQYTIEPGVVAEDHRFTMHHDAALHGDMAITAADLQGRATIVYDPLEHLDRRHVDLIADAAADASLSRFHAHHLGHDITEVMTTRAVVVGFIAAALEPGHVGDLHALVRDAKKRSNRYAMKLAGALTARRKARSAVGVLDAVAARTGGVVDDRDRLAMSLTRARACMESRMPGKAAEHMRVAVSCQPENPHLQAFHAACLLGSGDPVAAASAYEAAVTLQPDNAQCRREWEAVLAGLDRAAVAGA